MTILNCLTKRLLPQQGSGHKPGNLKSAHLVLYGSNEVPVHLRHKKRYPDQRLVSAALDKIEVGVLYIDCRTQLIK
jgi:hypothetical protein